MENITKEQADIIGEVANICTGTAATALRDRKSVV